MKNNKTLVIIFFALLGLLIAKKTILKPTTRSFKQALTSYDADKVDKLTIQVENAAMTTVYKEGGVWKATDGSRTVDAKESTVKAVVNELASLKTKQLVSRNSEKWVDYEVDDTKAKRIKIYSAGKEAAALHVGRFNFNQQTRAGTSYARLSSEDDIYAIDGFLAMSVAKDFNSFRETKLAEIQLSGIKQVSLEKGESTTSLSRSIDGGWLKQGMTIDSSSVAAYLTALNNINGTKFNDDFVEASSSASQTLKVGDLTISAYDKSDGGFIIKSNHNPAYFESDSTGVFNKIFIDFEALGQ